MTLRECYRILQVGNGASLDEVKKAYRTLAFELHPDLNPGRPDAARRFQRLNEAYVLLSRTLDAAGHGGNGTGGGGAGAAERESAEREATRAYEQARQRFGDMGTGGTGGAGGTGDGNGPSASSATGASSGAGASGASSATGPSGGPSGSTASGGASATRGASGADRNRRRAEATYQGRQDEVLQDILRDPFARRVFEDIYSQIRRDGGGGLTARPPKKRKLSLEWGGKALTLDLTHGIGGAMKGWLRRQIDDEQTVHLPAPSIVPGARLRLQVTQGLSGEVRTVEVTLPPDYVVGRPIRLKGLGKRIGPWQGDLYLRILAKVL